MNPIDKKFNELKGSAAGRGIKFSLTKGNVKKLLAETRCQYTGVEFTRKGVTHRTIERLDNRKGYEPGNVAPVTNIANNIKGNLVTVAQLKHRLDGHVVRARELQSELNGVRVALVNHNNNLRRVKRDFLITKSGTSKFLNLNRMEADLEAKIKDAKEYIEKLRLGIDRKLKKISALSLVIKTIEKGEDIGFKYLTWYQKLFWWIYK